MYKIQAARMMAGVPTLNAGLYHRIRFLVGDPVVLIELSTSESNKAESILILRDIEMDRAKKNARVDIVHCPVDFTPSSGLSGDRETATAQAAAEFLLRKGVKTVTVDRSLPSIYIEMLRRTGIAFECDMDWGVMERRQKDPGELRLIGEAQATTEEVMKLTCTTIANCSVGDDGQLMFEGVVLTSEKVQTMVDRWFLDRGYSTPGSIIACGPIGADCHDAGSGPLRTKQPIIVDLFPRNKKSLYNGDCTRTVVHGEISDTLHKMHSAVVKAKAAATAAVRANVTGHSVHQATVASIKASGFAFGLPPSDAKDDYTAMTHGTGHGLGLEVHEPPLLADGGIMLLEGDVVTIEPGLYSKAVGGIRVEDMVAVTKSGCTNFNKLPEGLDWKNG